MRKRTRITIILCLVAICGSGLAASSALGTTGATTVTSQTAPSTDGRADTAKDEVVYVKTNAYGATTGVYVVNIFNTTLPGTVTDHGAYEKVTNLTDSQTLTADGGAVTFAAPEGRFSYQGDMSAATALPWKIGITYKLDGKIIEADQLGGASGKLSIQVDVTPNKATGTAFSDNYLLQVSGSFPSDVASDVSCTGATLANAGSDRQVTFMVLPTREAHYTITAQVTDFTFDGFTIAGVPLNIALDLDDEDFTSGSSGITELQDAISQIDSGASSLASGTSSFGSGLSALASGGSELASGSSQVASGLSSAADGAATLSTQVSGKLVPGIEQMCAGSTAVLTGLNGGIADAQSSAAAYAAQESSAQAAYQSAFTAYTTAVATCVASGGDPSTDASVLSAAGDVQTALQAYMGVVAAAQSYGAAANALTGVRDGNGTTGGYAAYDAGVQSLVDTSSDSSIYALSGGASELSSGLSTLSDRYGLIDQGIASYTGGVSSLASNFSQLESGTSSLASGTSQLSDATSDLDVQIIDGIKDQLAQYLNSNFTPTSFVDSRNTDINQVQFVIMTGAITKPAEEAVTTEDNADETIWDRIVALFG